MASSLPGVNRTGSARRSVVCEPFQGEASSGRSVQDTKLGKLLGDLLRVAEAVLYELLQSVAGKTGLGVSLLDEFLNVAVVVHLPNQEGASTVQELAGIDDCLSEGSQALPSAFVSLGGSLREEDMKYLRDIRKAMTPRSSLLLAVSVALIGSGLAARAYRRRQKPQPR